MAKNIIVTNHAKKRAHERITAPSDAKNKKKKGWYKAALQSGKTPQQYEGEFHEFLMSKHNKKNAGIRVYDNNVFVFRGHTCVTVYNVPEEFQPTSKFLKKKKKKEIKVVAVPRLVNTGLIMPNMKTLRIGDLTIKKGPAKDIVEPTKNEALDIIQYYKSKQKEYEILNPNSLHLLSCVYIYEESTANYIQREFLDTTSYKARLAELLLQIEHIRHIQQNKDNTLKKYNITVLKSGENWQQRYIKEKRKRLNKMIKNGEHIVDKYMKELDKELEIAGTHPELVFDYTNEKRVNIFEQKQSSSVVAKSAITSPIKFEKKKVPLLKISLVTKIKSGQIAPPTKEFAEEVLNHSNELWYQSLINPNAMHLLKSIYVDEITEEKYMEKEYLNKQIFDSRKGQLLTFVEDLRVRKMVNMEPYNSDYEPEIIPNSWIEEYAVTKLNRIIKEIKDGSMTFDIGRFGLLQANVPNAKQLIEQSGVLKHIIGYKPPKPKTKKKIVPNPSKAEVAASIESSIKNLQELAKSITVEAKPEFDYKEQVTILSKYARIRLERLVRFINRDLLN